MSVDKLTASMQEYLKFKNYEVSGSGIDFGI